MIPSYLSDALAACEQALENPAQNQSDWKLACRTLGSIMQASGRFEEAGVWHARVLEKQPNLAQVYADLGIIYARQQLWQQAIAVCERALSLKSNCAEAYWCLAQIYSRLGHKEKEIECCYQTFSLRPDKAAARGHYKLGKAFFEQGKTERARTCYQRAIRRNSKFLRAYYDLGQIFSAQGQWEKASACYLRVLKQDSNQAMARYKLGTVKLKQEQFDEAIATFRECIQVNPDFPWSYHGIVKAFLQQQKWDEAIVTCRGIAALVREDPWVYVQQGNALVKKGELTEAYACYQKASELRGWHLCVQKGYQFTRDGFSQRIPIWERHLQPLADAPGINALEIGSFQGMSACWLLDHILTAPSARITCIDSKFQEQFEANIAKTGAAEKVTKLEGNVRQIISSLDHTYDLVNIQDRCKKASYIEQDASLCWNLLKVGGLMLFKDYGRSNADHPEQELKTAINAFVDSVKGQVEILHQANQVIVKKTAP